MSSYTNLLVGNGWIGTLLKAALTYINIVLPSYHEKAGTIHILHR